MLYKRLIINGTEYLLAVSQSGSGAPTATTPGSVGVLYMDTDKGNLYKCTGGKDGSWEWQQLSESGSEYKLPIAGEQLGGVKNGGNVTINPDGTMTVPDSSQNVDLTGYAKETWVQEGFQPKGNYLASTELTNAVNTALAQAKESGEFDGADGQDGSDGVGITSIEQTTASTADGGNNVFTVTLTNGTTATFTVKNGSKGSAGADGKDGTSVTVKSVSESTEDGGSNVVTFSDGKTLTVKNGSKGGPGGNQTAFSTFLDNTTVQYFYDTDANTFYSVIRINKTKVDGTEQYPFVFCNGTTYDDKISAYNVAQNEGFHLVINAGIFSTTNGTPDGVTIQNGVVITNTECESHPGSKPLTIDSNGDLGYAAHNVDANELVASGIVSAVCGFMPIVVDYEAVSNTEWNDVDHYTEGAQRQIIGQWGNGDYAIITGEGRDFHNSVGWTIEQAQNICIKHGLKFAYNLDGGGSTETVLGLKHINTIYEGSDGLGRRVSTHIVFNGGTTFQNPGATAVPQYTNLVPTSIDADGNVYNGVGYLDGYRISTSSGTKVQEGSTVTGFIPAKTTDIIRIAGVKFGSTASADTVDRYVNVGFHCYVGFYDANFDIIANFQYDGWKNAQEAGSAYTVDMSYDEATGVTTIDYSSMTDISNMAYIRINAAGNGADMVVTVNEEIT